MDTTTRSFELGARVLKARPAISTRVVVGLSLLVLLGPFFVAEIPPLTDYPNHLARFWLLAGGARDPAMAPFYQIDWSSASTNVGVDVVVAALSPLVAGTTSGRFAMILAALLPPLGLLALSLRLSGRLTSWQAVFPLAAWSTTFLMGFLNFQIGLGLALLFSALDPLARPGSRRIGALLRIPFGLVLAADHLCALVFYAALLAALGIGPEPLTTRRWRALASRLLRGALAAAWCAAPLAMTVLFARTLPGAQTDGGLSEVRFDALPAKLATLISPLITYNLGLELLLALGLLALVLWLRARRALEVHTGLAVAAAALVCVAIAAPTFAAGTGWVDRRFPIMALLSILAALQLRRTAPRTLVLAVGLAALALVTLKTAWVAWNWNAAEPNIAATRRALESVPAGAAVLPLQHTPTFAVKWSAPAGRYIWQVGDLTFRHYPALAVPLRRAFVPTLFVARGKQPLRVRGAWDRIVEHDGVELSSISVLSRPRRANDPSYLAQWRSHFDYILILNADLPDADGPFRPPLGIQLISDQGFAQLWRITRPAPAQHPS